jgi:hypothetical protein
MNWITNNQHVFEKAHRAGTVDAGRLDQLVGHREEELAEQERRGRRRDQRDRQAGVGVQHVQVRHHLVGRKDAHLHRQHQRDEHHPEADRAAREAEIDEGERRQQRDRDLAERDHQRRDQAHCHHRCHRRHPAAIAGLAAEQRDPVGLQHVTTGRQRHRHRLHDLLRGLGRRDQRHVDREGDDHHAQDQHQVRDRAADSIAFNHQRPPGRPKGDERPHGGQRTE